MAWVALLGGCQGAPATVGERPDDGGLIDAGPPRPDALVTTLPGLRLVPVAAGLDRPVWVGAPSGDDRLFILEQHLGVIRLWNDGRLEPQPFLDVAGEVGDGVEQGLIGMAFHPEFAANRRFFVTIVADDGVARVIEYRASAADPDRADESSRRLVFELAQPFDYHNLSSLAFGPDGLLYISSGDGGGTFDPADRAQQTGDLHGKVLRIDVDAAAPYAIPASNPWGNECWVRGLRNPWGLSFDAATGEVYLPDVGQGQLEELNILSANSPGGGNFGWDITEGTAGPCYNTSTCDRTGLRPPDFEYAHDDFGGCAIIGGHVYRGSEIAELQGWYLFADYCDGRSFALRWDGQAVREVERVPGLDVGERLPAFGVGGDRELYVAQFHHLVPESGRVSRVERAP